MTKLTTGTEDDDSSQLQKFLEQVEEEGGTVDCEFDAEGKVAVLFVSTYAMKQAFLTSPILM